MFSCSGDYYLIRQLMPPPSQSQGVSHVKLQKHNGTYWLQADRRVTVDNKSSANALAGFSLVQMAPIPNSAEAGRVSKEAVPTEHGQPLRAVETDEWATKVRAKPTLETPAQRQRDIHELTHFPPVPWCPACVSGKATDDPHRRRQDAKDSGRCFV